MARRSSTARDMAPAFRLAERHGTERRSRAWCRAVRRGARRTSSGDPMPHGTPHRRPAIRASGSAPASRASSIAGGGLAGPVPGAGAEAGARPRRRGRGVRSGARARSGAATGAPSRSRPAARRMLEALGVWEAVADGGAADPRHGDHRQPPADPVRPVFLTFDGEVEPGEPFAHMVESGAAHGGADATPAATAGVDLQPAGVVRLRAGHGRDPAAIAPTAAALAGGPPGRGRRGALAPARGRPASAGSAGPTRSPASSRRSRTSATTRAAPSSTSCRPARSRSCRLRPGGPSATAPRSSGRSAADAVPASSRSTARRPAGRARAALRPGARRIALETRPRRLPARLRHRPPLRAPSGSRSSATRRTSSTRSPARASTSACTTRRRWPRASSTPCASASIPAAPDVLARLRARAPLRHRRDGRRDRRAQPPVLERRCCRCASLRDLGLGLVDRHAGAEALLHPRGGGPRRRRAAADAGRGAVWEASGYPPFAFARSMPSRISRCASSGSPQRTILTHLPGSRSL